MTNTTPGLVNASPPVRSGMRFGLRWVILALPFLGITLNHVDRRIVILIVTPDDGVGRLRAMAGQQDGNSGRSLAILSACV